MNSKDWKNYLLEGALIVFSVLLALFLNQMAENIKTKHAKETAVDGIQKELERNLSIVQEWNKRHSEILDLVSALRSGKRDSLKQRLQNGQLFKIQLITNNKSIIDANLSNTAWETAKSTQIIAEFRYETVEKLTDVYALQDILINTTLKKITDTYFDRRTHNLDNLEATLTQFQLGFAEMIGQENLITELYREAIEELKGTES